MVVWLPAYKNMNNLSMRSLFLFGKQWSQNSKKAARKDFKNHNKSFVDGERTYFMFFIMQQMNQIKRMRSFPSSICSSSLLFLSRTVGSPIRWTKSSSILRSDLSTSSPREHYVYGKLVRVRQCKADTLSVSLSVQWPPTTGHAHSAMAAQFLMLWAPE